LPPERGLNGRVARVPRGRLKEKDSKLDVLRPQLREREVVTALRPRGRMITGAEALPQLGHAPTERDFREGMFAEQALENKR